MTDTETQVAKDARIYWERKRNGEFKENDWVVIKNGAVLIQTPDEKEADTVVANQEGMSILYQVGHEDDVAGGFNKDGVKTGEKLLLLKNGVTFCMTSVNVDDIDLNEYTK